MNIDFKYNLKDKLIFLSNNKITVGYVVGREYKEDLQEKTKSSKVTIKSLESYTLELRDGSRTFRTNNVNDLFTSKEDLISHMESQIKDF